MGWIVLLVLALAVLAALWRFAGFNAVLLQFVAAGLLLAMAGYAWQGKPGLAGSPLPPLERRKLPDSEFAKSREAMLGRFDSASRWLIIAESYQRRGDTQSAAETLRSGLRAHPRDPDLWVGLGNALVLHGGGMMNPAAQLAFQRASALAPNHPGPPFFYGLALAQSGRLDEAERIWRALLADAPAQSEWRTEVERRLQIVEEIRAMAVGSR